MKSDLFTIMKKEFARFFGDKRMIMTAIMPGILIYVLYTFMGSGFSEMYATDEDYVYQVNVVNMPQVMTGISEIENINIANVEETEIEDIKTQIREDATELLVVFPADFDEAYLNGPRGMSVSLVAPNVEIYYDSADTESAGAYKILVSYLDVLEEAQANIFDICSGEKEYDLASDEDVSAMIISMIMPMLVLMMLFNGCLATAVESIAGEKERGTIATLLVTPMKRRDLALGKVISLSAIGLISGISSFVGIMLSLPNLMGGSGLENMSFGYTIKDYAVLLLVIISTTFVIVGMISILSTFAKSVKEATSMATPLMVVVTLTGLSNMMGMPEDWYMYLVPIYNTAQCMNGVFSMDYQMLPVVVTVVANVLFSGVFVVVLTKMFNSERIMYT
ncbi:MAG: ABC transporter permease [Agathobacter sp.]|nr:ABC transporter permease [Agathobacter sp.]